MTRYRELGNSAALPRVEMFFPKTRRGHGSAHGPIMIGVRTRSDGTPWKAPACSNPTCITAGKGGKELHQGQDKNREDWEANVGIR